MALTLEQFGGGIACADNGPAMAAALAALPAFGGAISFDAGIYNFSAPIEFTCPATNYNLTLSGTGPESTQHNWPQGGDGIILHQTSVQNSFQISDMSIVTQVVGGVAIAVSNLTPIYVYNYLQSSIRRVTIRGPKFLGPVCWADGVILTSVHGVKFDSLICEGYMGTGTGVVLAGNSSWATLSQAAAYGDWQFHLTAPAPPELLPGMYLYAGSASAAFTGSQFVKTIQGNLLGISGNAQTAIPNGSNLIFCNAAIVYNFTGCSFNALNVGISIRTGVQGVTVTGGCNFTGGNIGISVPVNEFGLVQLTVSDSQFAVSKYQIYSASPFADVIIRGNLFLSADSTGVFPAVNLYSMTRAIISGNDFVQFGQPKGSSVGLYLNGPNGAVTGNLFTGFSTGVNLGNAATGVTVSGNSYPGSTSQVRNGGNWNITGNPV